MSWWPWSQTNEAHASEANRNAPIVVPPDDSRGATEPMSSPTEITDDPQGDAVPFEETELEENLKDFD